MKQLTQIQNEQRKNQHIAICGESDVESSDRKTGFEDYNFVPQAFPELDWNDLDIHCSFLNRQFSAPFLISGMTGGIEKGKEINQRLAAAASALNIPMGVGSQRIALESPELAEIFQLKNSYPDLFLIGNLGLAQLRNKNFVALAKTAVSMIDADALAIHANVLQELIQDEGDRDFSAIINRIAELTHQLSVPVIIKEVGCGIDPQTALQLKNAGVAAIDVGGRGGTSWAYIEGARSHSEETKQVADTFRDWGIPTAYALHALSKISNLDCPLIATGGMRNGLMSAKAIALGASMVGFGLPLFRAALISEDAVLQLLLRYIRELKTSMMVCGSKNLRQLSSKIHFGDFAYKGIDSNGK
ncbi:MAG: type 2 isopentenyl-diphosphate Delta-isomerase [Oligoflexales bacterium]|nr:type 2 isopentenyl-diphosphate Delta-isomerase [Oligoflexales bacterium]